MDRCSGYPFNSCIRIDAEIVVGEFVFCEECKKQLDKDMSRTFRSIRFRR